MIGLYVSNFKVNEIRYDYDKQVFINTDGYWYARIGNRDALERIRAILISSPVSPADQQGAIDRS